MTKKADIGGKRLISLSPNQWIEWVTQTEIPLRMFSYTALATEKYQKPVFPVLVNILPPSSTIEIVSQYHSEFWGLINHCDYRVINLWEVEANLVFEKNISTLLPFVPILKGGGETAVVREALNRLRKTPKLDELEPLLAFFATFVLESRIIQEIMRWDMVVLRESPWYQEILKESEKIGINLVVKQEIISSIEFGLELKFGSAGLALLDQIRTIDNVEILQQIKNALRTANTLEEIRQVYE